MPTRFGADAPRSSRANSPGAGDGKGASARGCVQQRLAEGPPPAPPPALISIDRSAVSKGKSENGQGLYLEGPRSGSCRFCCKSLFALAIKISFGCTGDFHVNMWGTSSSEEKLAGDPGNVIEATSIGGRRSDFLQQEN